MPVMPGFVARPLFEEGAWKEPSMVVLRFKRMGRSHRPFYRLGAMDKRSQRDGRVIEELGWYDPMGPADKQMNFNVDRIKHWLAVGAQPSETVADLIKQVGIEYLSKKNAGKQSAKHAKAEAKKA
jgi:small subunit ribosomal protein S16